MTAQSRIPAFFSRQLLLIVAVLVLLLCLTFGAEMARTPLGNLRNAIDIVLGMPALDADSSIADWEAPVCNRKCTTGMPALDADSSVADGEGRNGTDRSNIG